MDENNLNEENVVENATENFTADVNPNPDPIDNNNVEYTAVPNGNQTSNTEDGTNHPMNIAALVCGILGIAGNCIPYVSSVAWLLAILGIVFGVIGKKYPGAKLGKAGMICGIVGLGLLLLLILLGLILGAAVLSVAGQTVGNL